MSPFKVENLIPFELLKGLSLEECEPFSAALREAIFPAGTIIFNEGDPGSSIYFLFEGDIEITQALTLRMSKAAYDTREKSIVRLHSSTTPVIGEVSLFSNDDKRTATVKALTKCRMGILEGQDFFRIMEKDPSIGYKVMTNMSRIVIDRLITANQNVLKLTTAFSLILEK